MFIRFYIPNNITEPIILVLIEKTILISNFNYGEKKNSKNLFKKIRITTSTEKLKKKNRLL